MKKKVILTKKFQNSVIKKLKNDFNLIIAEDQDQSLKELFRKNSDCQALIPFLSDNIDKSLMDMLPDLKIIANYAVGYNNIDVPEAKRRGIKITNTPDVLTDATADLTFALILAVARRIVEADEFMRNGRFKEWGANLLLGKELRGTTLGIVGMGKIGRETALRSLAFGMNVIYFSRTRKADLEKRYGFKYSTLENLIKSADVVSLHLPYSKESHHLFNKKTFKKMKNNSIFINVARGKIMNENDLAEALETGEISGAGIDVFEFEPKVNERLKRLKNVVMTPHIGSATNRARTGMAEMVYDNVRSALNGEEPKNLIKELK